MKMMSGYLCPGEIDFRTRRIHGHLLSFNAQQKFCKTCNRKCKPVLVHALKKYAKKVP